MANSNLKRHFQPADVAVVAPEHEQHARRILEAVEAGEVSQRSLARELGIALGLTNLLVKKLVRRGWVRVIHVKPNRVAYLITPSGIAEKVRMSRAVLDSNVQFYRKTRDRIHQQFSVLSATWPGDGAGGPKRIVFYAAGEVAEIGYICLAETDLHLVGVIDPDAPPAKRFFNLTVCAPAQLQGMTLDGHPFDRLVVMSFRRLDELRAEVQALGAPADRVFWL